MEKLLKCLVYSQVFWKQNIRGNMYTKKSSQIKKTENVDWNFSCSIKDRLNMVEPKNGQ